MDANLKELIKMVENFREEYRDYMEDEKELGNKEKEIRFKGAIEGFNVILDELRDMHIEKYGILPLEDYQNTLMKKCLRRNLI